MYVQIQCMIDRFWKPELNQRHLHRDGGAALSIPCYQGAQHAVHTVKRLAKPVGKVPFLPYQKGRAAVYV